MGLLLNRAKAQCNAAGTGTVTPGAASGPYRAWAAAGAQAGYWYDYLIEQGADWEMGVGLYNGTTISRPGPAVDPWFESSTGALLIVNASATIACVANRYTLAAGAPFMPPMSSYFPTTNAAGRTVTRINDPQAGFIMKIDQSVGGDAMPMVTKAITNSTWSSVARFTWSKTNTNYLGAGFQLFRSASNRVVTHHRMGNFMSTARTGYPSGWNSNINTSNPWLGERWLKIDFNGTTYTFSYSDDGSANTFKIYATEAAATWLGGAADQFGIGFECNIADGNPQYVACSYWWDNA